MNFREVLEKDYSEMLDLKESMGYCRTTYQSQLREFLSYCAESYPEATVITKTMFDNWLQTQKFSSNGTHIRAVY